VLLFGAFLLVYVGIEASFSHWAYSVQVIARSTPPLLAGYGVSAYWLGLTVGRFLLGYGLRFLGAIRIITLSLGLLMVGLVGWWQWPSGLLSLPLIGLALAAMFPTMIWLIPKRLPEAMVPAAVGFATSSASMGAALIPAGVGWMAGAAGLAVVPLLMLPLAVTLAILHGWLMRQG
jgi:fucose permease